jgi:hypothetical protein
MDGRGGGKRERHAPVAGRKPHRILAMSQG